MNGPLAWLAWTGAPLLWDRFIELVKWLGLFAMDRDKGTPSTKNGIMLMGMTTLCIAALWIVFRAPWVPGYMAIIIEVLLVVATASGLTYAVTKGVDTNAKVRMSKNQPPPGGPDGSDQA